MTVLSMTATVVYCSKLSAKSCCRCWQHPQSCHRYRSFKSAPGKAFESLHCLVRRRSLREFAETAARIAREAISGWKENARGISNFKVRVSHHVEDTYIASWMLIDGKVLRIDIYDPIRQRSLEGFMVEVTSLVGQDLNIVVVFREYFWRAWGRAQPVEWRDRIWWWIRKAWQWLACLMFLALTYIFRSTFLVGVFGSAAASFMISGLVSSWSSITSFLTYDD